MAKKKIKIVPADAKTSETIQRIEHFSSRFNIEAPQSNKKQFQYRCISAISEYVGDSVSNINYVSSKVFFLLGLPYTGTSRYGFSGSALEQTLSHEKLSPTDDASLNKWLMILECLLNIEWQDDYGKYSFVSRIAESLKMSGINAILCDTSNGYLFYPANAELLDQKVVIDVLNWLSAYSLAKEQYDQALRMFLKGDRTRHIIDGIRLSFELFLKQFFDNNASIENQVNLLGQYLKDSDVSVEIRNMFSKLIGCFTAYNNQHIKHNDDSETIAESEIEFLIYLTGSFIRCMIQLKKENDK